MHTISYPQAVLHLAEFRREEMTTGTAFAVEPLKANTTNRAVGRPPKKERSEAYVLTSGNSE